MCFLNAWRLSSCSCAEVADMVGDMGSLRASLRAESFAMATDYSEYSQGVVDHMVLR
jgi:hypothetical protein